MLEDRPKARSPELDQAYETLVKEETHQIGRERRSTYRQPFVRPLTINLRSDGEKMVKGFSKNLSPLGIGVLTETPFNRGDVATLEIHRIDRPPLVILAECRWADSFGAQWFMSGWVFLNIVRG